MGCSDSKSAQVSSQSKVANGPSDRQPETNNSVPEAESSSKASIVLYYFDVRARAEPIRLILHYSGIQFDDRRLTNEEWGNIKKNGEFCGHFGQLPYAEVNGEAISQSKALIRFAAREAGVLGENAWEIARADSLVDTENDILMALARVEFSTGDDAEAMKAEFVGTTLPLKMARLEKTLEANNGGKGFLVGNKVTHADFVLFNVIETVENLAKAMEKGDMLDNYPLIKDHTKRIRELPTLQDYLKDRPDTKF
ncbi:glutathione S-transferase-like isoform X2 [Ptychodera flava]|uniref:glutathione S-transferase-like isoform X2 n=1 Tax=Ptychodera flava TaxID=63121 RepID=UPI00396A017D